MTSFRFRGSRFVRLVGVCVGLLGAVVSGRAANDMFLSISTLPGESLNQAHPNTIEVMAFSWGVSAPVSLASGSYQVGKASAQDFAITKRTDKTSPRLMLAVFQGTRFATVTFFVQRSGPTQPFDYLKVTLEDVVVSSFSVSGSQGDDALNESVSLSFARVKIEYTPSKATGEADLANKVTTGWDIAANRTY